ncbi:MAG: hypothetical protein NT082_05780, partial [Chloroflexi bacterium]|nr:hypothetical protein [Chloroflexota bacterium]
MKRIFSGLFSLITALALIIPATAPVFAESDDAVKPQLSSWASLMIKAPGVADVSQPVTITVFGKQSRGTVAGAAVYALKTSDIVITADKTNYTSILADYEALAEAKGIFIGNTGDDGTVKGNFSETGRFLLVATKDGFIPGFSRITISLAAKKGLNMRNPGAAEVNKAVTFTVTERYSSTPVAGASIYAQLITEISLPQTGVAPIAQPVQVQAQIRAQTHAQVQAQITASTAGNSGTTGASQPQVVGNPLPLINATLIKADPANTEETEQYAAGIKESGIYRGNTDDKGQLTYTFTATGSYVLTAVRDEYAPVFSRISIFLADQKKLGVKSPGSAEAGAGVDFFVIGRNTGQAVSGAALWALRLDDIKETAGPVWDSLVSGSAQSDVIDKYQGWAQQKGILLGYSSDTGRVNYTFTNTGRYLLAAVKDEYAPGFSRINITLAGRTATQVVIDSSFAGAVATAEAQALMVQSKDQPVLLGYTSNNGELQYTFSEAGRYTLVAYKDGYLPGGTRINILAQAGKALEVNALFNITSGQPVYIVVREKSTAQPVPKALVYVLKISDAAEIKPMPPTAKNDKAQNEANKAKAKEKGAFAGYTDDSGQVVYNFSSSGQYFLAAFKDGYEPAFTYITYTLPVTKKVLYIKSPAEAYISDPVDIGVFDGSGKGVNKAALYAVKMDIVEEAASVLNAAPSIDTAVKEKYAPILRERSAFLGYTDGNGRLQV